MDDFNYPDVPQKQLQNQQKTKEYYEQKNGMTKQDIISQSDFSHLLRDYHLMKPEEYNAVPLGSFIRYITNEGKYRIGGYLVRNAAPIYYQLKSGESKWSIQLQNQKEIYYKTRPEKQKETYEMQDIYEKYLKGEIGSVTVEEYNDLVDQLTELDRAYQKLLIQNKKLRHQLRCDSKKISELEKECLKRTRML